MNAGCEPPAAPFASSHFAEPKKKPLPQLTPIVASSRSVVAVPLPESTWRKFVPLPHLPFVGRIQKLNVNGWDPLGRHAFADRSALRARRNTPPFFMSCPSPKRTARPTTPSATW